MLRQLLAFALASGFLATADASALRCGQRLISIGDHEAKLLHYCGEPLSVESRYAQGIYVGDAQHGFVPGLFQNVVVEEWTYNFGPHRLMRIVRIEDGIVTDIRRLGYGFPQSP